MLQLFANSVALLRRDDHRKPIDDWTPVTAWVRPCNFTTMNDPGRMTAYLADRSPPSCRDSITRLVQARQQRGKIRSDYPARPLAPLVLPAWDMSTHRKTELATPGRLGRRFTLAR